MELDAHDGIGADRRRLPPHVGQRRRVVAHLLVNVDDADNLGSSIEMRRLQDQDLRLDERHGRVLVAAALGRRRGRRWRSRVDLFVMRETALRLGAPRSQKEGERSDQRSHAKPLVCVIAGTIGGSFYSTGDLAL
jgi:hypothetical protein